MPATLTPTRFEFKFTVDEPLAAAIRTYAAPWVEPDKHVRPGERGYTITSLYLDSPDLAFYWAKLTLQYARVKARVRTYGQYADGPVFFELKRRFGDVFRKSRAEVHRPDWTAIVEPVDRPMDLEDLAVKPSGRAVVTDFVALTRAYDLRPVILVRYDREPYVDRTNTRIRLTFDRALRCQLVRPATLGGDDTGYRVVDYAAGFDQPRSQVIVEMKFDAVAPMWMQDLVCHFDLFRTAFSKYAIGMKVLLDEDRIDSPGRLVGLARG